MLLFVAGIVAAGIGGAAVYYGRKAYLKWRDMMDT